MKQIFFLLVFVSVVFADQKEVEVLKQRLEKLKKEQKVLKKVIEGLQSKIPPENIWKTHFELGYIDTNGNTNTTSFNTDLKIQKRFLYRHLLIYTFDAQYSKEDEKTGKNKYFTELIYKYEMKELWKFTYLSGYKKDKFSAFDYQFYTGPGVLYKVFKTDKEKLSLECSILYSVDKRYSDEESQQYVSGRLKGNYFYKIMDGLVLSEEASYRTELKSAQNYFIYSVTKLTSKIYKYFSMNLSYKVDYTSEANEKENLDTTFSINGVVDF